MRVTHDVFDGALGVVDVEVATVRFAGVKFGSPSVLA